MLYEFASGDLVGWLLAAILIGVSVLISTTATRGFGAQALFILAVLARVALSALSSFNIFLPPNSDRLDFHVQASQMATSGIEFSDLIIGHQIYALLLSLFYQLFGTSIFLGCMVSLIPFVLSLIFLLKFLRLLGLEKFETSALLFFGLAPGMILYANFTYREPLQILFMMMAVYYGLLYRRNASLGSLIVCAAALFAFALLHAKFFLVAPLILMILFFWPRGRGEGRVKVSRGARLFASIVGGGAVTSLAIAAVFTQSGDNSLVDVLATGGVADYMLEMKYTMQGIAPRTLLPFQLESSSPAEFAYKAPLMLFQYMFAPLLPWTVSEAQDLVALLDTGLRTILLVFAVRTLRQAPRGRRSEIVVLLLIYIVFSLVASLGTAAVGTAIRHQIKVSWILVLLGGPGLMRSFAGATARHAHALR